MAAAALAILIYVANVEGWWDLGSNRLAAVTMLAVGAIGCSVGARIVDEKVTSPAIAALGVLGLTALVIALVSIATAAQWALFMLAALVVVLWAGATLRHAVTPPPDVHSG
jgi:hypothetical protein